MTGSTAREHAARSGVLQRMMRSWGEPYLLLLPGFLLVLGITVYPILDLFWISFHSTFYFQVGDFNWGRNYLPLLSSSGMRSFAASAIFVVASNILTLAIALVLALLLEAPLKSRGIIRTLIIVPWLVSHVVTALIWQAMLDPNFGPLAQMVRTALGLTVAPLADQTGAMVAMVIANVWGSYPFAMILVLAALQSIPQELYEAARIDGATKWDELRKITLPIIMRTMLVVLILLTLQFFTLVTLPFILTAGGPSEATYVLALRVWREAFTNYQVGFSAAVGVVVFLLNFVVSIVYIRYFVLRGGGHVSK